MNPATITPIDAFSADQQRHPSATSPGTRILILGAGFGGLYTAKRLEKIFRHHADVEITLVSRENYFLMTPLLFEAGSGVLEPRHAVNPIRPMFKKTRFIEAGVEHINFDSRTVLARHSHSSDRVYELHYDQLVLALGGVTNTKLIPGSEHAHGFKTLRDAIFLRNTLIDLFEQADVEENPDLRRRLLSFVIIGGGLVGVELMGELTEFVANLLRNYPRIPRDLVRFTLVEFHDRLIPEMEEPLARYAAEALQERGVRLILNTRVQSIEKGRVHLPPSGGAGGANAGHTGDGGGQDPSIIEAATIILAAGVVANPLLNDFPLPKAKNGRILVESTMRCKEHPEIWALGDCASIPDPKGNPYPPLAQHALREAYVLACNIAAVIHHHGKPGPEPELKPIVYKTLGMLASLGHYNGVGRVLNINIHGFAAWWVWRTYYLFQMPRAERRIRIMMDWTVALFFRNDVVKLDFAGELPPVTSHSSISLNPPPPPAPHA